MSTPEYKYPPMPRVKGHFFCIACDGYVDNTYHFATPGHSPRERIEEAVMAAKRQCKCEHHGD